VEAGVGWNDAPGLVPGERFGRYVLLERVGRGAMGTVFAAYDEKLDRRVALKVIDRSAMEDARETLRLQSVREAQALAKLSHPNVVTVHDVDEHEGRLFIAMEFIDGETLGRWSRRAERPWEEILAVLVAVGRGLEAVHRAELLHGDVKPANVMVDRGGRARLMDFGLARRKGGIASLSREPQDPEGEHPLASSRGSWETAVGTPAYMAPEQHLGLDGDARSDQFSFCVTAYEALARRRLFEAETLAALVTEITTGDVPSAPADSPVPARVWAVLQRGLARAPDERWPSMQTLVDALDPTRHARGGWRSWGAWLAVGGLAAVGLAVAFGESERPCAEVSQELDAVWSEPSREAMRVHVSEVLGRTAPGDSVVASLDRFTDDWRQRRLSACLAEEADAIGREDAELRRTCLDIRLLELRTWLEVLETDVPQELDLAIRGLPAIRSPRECDDISSLAVVLPGTLPQAALEEARSVSEAIVRARVYEEAARIDEALEAFERLVQRTASGELPALHAEALVGRANVRMRRRDLEPALEDAAAAFRLAIAHGHDRAVLASCVSMLKGLNERGASTEAIDAWAQVGLAYAERVDDAGARAQIYEALGMAYSERDPQASAEHFRRALESEIEAHGEDSRSAAIIELNIGVAASRRQEAELAVDALEGALGKLRRIEAPEAAVVLHASREYAAALMLSGRLDDAHRESERNRENIEQVLGTDHQVYAQQLELMAAIACERATFESCRELALEAIRVYGATIGEANPALIGPLMSLVESSVALGRIEEARDGVARGRAVADSIGMPEVAEHFGKLIR
jgi:eukaryotic-like serine/threonine-protein kinase